MYLIIQFIYCGDRRQVGRGCLLGGLAGGENIEGTSELLEMMEYIRYLDWGDGFTVIYT